MLVAEQAATLDLLSNGRFDFGVGKGYRFAEFAGFRIGIDEAGPRFEEAMTVIRRAWSDAGRFSHRGTYWPRSAHTRLSGSPPADRKAWKPPPGAA